jgi:transcriptional regulator with XRE-family HTH domain
MSERIERTFVCRAEEIEERRKARGWSVGELAKKARVDTKTLKRLLSGEPGYLATIERVARALSTTCSVLLQQPNALEAPAPPPKDNTFRVNLSIHGTFESPEQSRQLLSLGPEVIENLEAAGLRIDGSQAEVSVTDGASDTTRTIVLIYGQMEHGGPFWVFVAIKPSKYREFVVAQATKALDLYKFEPYGEIIVSGEGSKPPEEVTLKVAEMYQTDPKNIFGAIRQEEGLGGGQAGQT